MSSGRKVTMVKGVDGGGGGAGGALAPPPQFRLSGKNENKYRADENRSIRQVTSHVNRFASIGLNLSKLLNVSALIPVCKSM